MMAPATSKSLTHVDAEGKPLYRFTSGGNLARTSKLSKSRKAAVLRRDQNACVECFGDGAGWPLEIHHVVRYVEGGGNDLDNLVTLCHDCHTKVGG